MKLCQNYQTKNNISVYDLTEKQKKDIQNKYL